MASDSICVDDGPSFTTDKIFTAKDGTLIGIAGVLTDCLMFVKWYQAGMHYDALPTFSADSFNALTLNHHGCFFYDSKCVPILMKDEYTSIGTGGAIANTCLFLGKSIEEAMETASVLDPYTGGQLVFKKFIRKRRLSHIKNAH
jgi:hypothetical protein